MTKLRKLSMLVATDLDGTLLDHFSYSWQPAKPGIDALLELGVEIVINTSKTFSEVLELQTTLNLNAPFIVENGSAIYIPNEISTDAYHSFDSRYSRIVLGLQYAEILEKLYALRTTHQWLFEGYNDWGTDKVMKYTGLDEVSALKSRQRQFSEPLIWRDSDENYRDFCEAIRTANLRIIRGGRFIHILGQCDKGSSLLELRKLEKATESTSLLVCLGDSDNDLDMLEVADIPVFVRSPVHDFPAHHCTNAPIFTTACGPEGWNEAITHILRSYSTTNS